MNHSKSIYEKVKLYRITLIRNRRLSVQKDKKFNSIQSKNIILKKQSKLKILFKFILGFIGSFFEYLVMESNKKNTFKVNKNVSNELENLKNEENILYFDENLVLENKNKKTEEILSNADETKNIKKNNTLSKTIEINIDVKNDKILKKDFDEDKNTNIDLKSQKNNLILLEEQIIYADTREELKIAKTKIMNLKNNLISKKQNNIISLEYLDNDKHNNRVLYSNSNQNSHLFKDDKKQSDNLDDIKNGNIYSVDNILIKKNIAVDNFIDKKRKILIENNIENDKIIKRCDDDLLLITEKQNFLTLQENFEKNLNNNSTNIRINKKDLKKIEENMLYIVEKQKYNLAQLNNFMDKSFDEEIFTLKVGNFFKSTTKLAFSFVPFFSFPNKIFGLATSALFFNRSIKSYRIKPNKNDINQNIRSMINNNEMCLKIGISNCNDSLNEIENIKYYLGNLSSEAKDSIEYRKYLLSVESTEKLIQKQIDIMKNLSKKYDDIKIKVKRREN